MRLVIDFDYTLFDTACLRAKLIMALADFGITKKQFQETEKQVLKKGVYVLIEHLQQLSKISSPRVAVSDLVLAVDQVFFDLSPCVYGDAREFLEQAKQKKILITILSFGHLAFQKRKILASGLDAWADEVIVTDQPKEKIIDKWDKNDIIFINDRGQEIDKIKQKYPQLQAVWLHRKHTPYDTEPCHRADQELAKFNFNKIIN
ncbi:MAG: hypothetical protein A2233_01105 [Candidatus Kerfeldbacteria bacterium RIFOXYA2_FULL_38_24]|uniref:Haloacid dehalogenase n=1 Tax=Candidatus Kerfeldbacteria bacterium RIFOXYB2_FULL_38_14 TaxID=1798547 RepID=A0A1G2BBX3_9BACT|nr:MAG: hypothetical protein A2233_01105 [Candidatus Kerfeldbacteria bacterium RIFOXYA2_FULL_38_24]OGY86535.1 MAG: hypothetical protein A2319_02095 [Candidatus Kerfeldbacteria bacterium RIFOXYB2_FULL_38_14]OGY89262.1 MAG: hypothetical protein A2458_00780 [Candidatus Kerfeldbacteria bacterium RIFOXYC2_FULL_38_9]